MSTEASDKKKLFFVKSPGYATSTAENFLKKRNFEVFSETAVNVALAKIFEIQPDFIFIALDHSDPAIDSLPKLIAQASVSPVIPYITSSSRNDNRKLNSNPSAHKLYPPISGPAIERLVLKTYKQAAAEEARLNDIATEDLKIVNDTTAVKAEKKSNMTYIRSSPGHNVINRTKIGSSDSSEAGDDSEHSEHEEKQKYIRHKSIYLRNNILKTSQQQKLSNDKINSLKNSLNSMVKEPLSSLLTSLKESQNPGSDETEKSNNSYTQNNPSFKNSTLRSGASGPLDSGSQHYDGKSLAQQNSALHKGSSPSDLGSNIEKDTKGDFGNSLLQGGAAGSLDSDFYQSGAKGADPHSISQNENESKLSAHNFQKSPQANIEQSGPKAYCMALYSDNWCGYLIISTEAELDFSTVDIIFTEWIKTQFDNLQQVDEYDYFELNNTDYKMIQDVITDADYHESVSVNDYNLSVSFFQVNPKDMAIELNEDKNLIKILTEDVPAGLALDFSLHLHLPENKKYLLYTQAHRPLNPEQKERLINNKISALYTSLDFEKEYKKFLAERNVKILYENLYKKIKSV